MTVAFDLADTADVQGSIRIRLVLTNVMKKPACWLGETTIVAVVVLVTALYPWPACNVLPRVHSVDPPSDGLSGIGHGRHAVELHQVGSAGGSARIPFAEKDVSVCFWPVVAVGRDVSALLSFITWGPPVHAGTPFTMLANQRPSPPSTFRPTSVAGSMSSTGVLGLDH